MPKIVDHEAYRAELLDGAFAVFAERGFAHVTMRGIAKHLGVSTGTLYHYFATKDAILEATIRHVASDYVLRLLRETEGLSSVPERVAALVAFVDRHEDAMRNLLFMSTDLMRQPDPALSREVIGGVTRYIVEAVREQVGDDAAGRAPMIFQLAVGVLMHRFLDPGAAELSEQLEVLLEIVGRG